VGLASVPVIDARADLFRLAPPPLTLNAVGVPASHFSRTHQSRARKNGALNSDLSAAKKMAPFSPVPPGTQMTGKPVPQKPVG
jgi:hypothetical protein